MNEPPMPDPIYHPTVYLAAHDLLTHMLENFEIQFQIDGPQMPRAKAVEHFKTREALIIVKTMLLDEGERIAADLKKPLP